MIGSVHARLISALIADDVRRAGLIGRVHSVFQRALNLVTTNQDLIGVVLAEGGNGPANGGRDGGAAL